jgi:CRISPR-associated protein Csm1
MKPTSQLIDRTHLLAAAGLWHDLGKVGEPADAKLDPHVANLDQTLCPTGPDGRYTHRHVLCTAQLFETAVSSGCTFGGLSQEALFRIAASHHVAHAGSLDEAILKKADWLASGHDRRQADVEDPRALVVTGLRPITASLSLASTSGPAVQSVPGQTDVIIFPGILEWDERSIFPVSAITRQEYAQACAGLWNALLQHIPISALDPGEYVERLQALCYRVLHAVPASRQVGQQADVPLYDHSHLTAAFAACLGCLYEPQTTQETNPDHLPGRYRILQLAVGNIQAFIVRSVSLLDAPVGETAEKGMARRLRARSFFVSLLTWLAARRVLQAAGLPRVNLIFDGGGRAIILLPDHEGVLNRVREALRTIEIWFADTMGGLLRWDVAWSRSLTDADFGAERFAATYREVAHGLAEARYSGSFAHLRNDQGWNEAAWVSDELTIRADHKDFQDRLQEIGRFLPRAKYLRVTDGPSPTEGPSLEIFGYTVELLDQLPRNVLVYALDLSYSQRLDQPVWLVGSHVPVASDEDLRRLASDNASVDSDSSEPLEKGDIIPFEELSQLSEDEERRRLSHPMLAVLKADVDHLGLLLSVGLGRSVSFGRLAALARSLNQFFKGFLNHKIAQCYSHIYTVFAGGDDLFLIGPWFDIVRLTGGFHDWFVRFTCGNPAITISSGIVFAQPKIPVRHLAHAAETALEEAKDNGRNRVTFTSQTMTWDLFKDGVCFAQDLRTLARADNGRPRPVVSSAMVYRFLQYACMARRKGQKHGQKPSLADLKWRAQMSYDIKRNLPDPNSSQPALARVHESLAKVQTAEDAASLYVAAMLTLYSLRGERS